MPRRDGKKKQRNVLVKVLLAIAFVFVMIVAFFSTVVKGKQTD